MLVTIKLTGLEDYLKKMKKKANRDFNLGVLFWALSYVVSSIIYIIGDKCNEPELYITAATFLIFLQIVSSLFFCASYEAKYISGYSNAENFVKYMLNGNIYIDSENNLRSDTCDLDDFDYILKKQGDDDDDDVVVNENEFPYLLGRAMGNYYVFSLYV